MNYKPNEIRNGVNKMNRNFFQRAGSKLNRYIDDYNFQTLEEYQEYCEDISNKIIQEELECYKKYKYSNYSNLIVETYLNDSEYCFNEMKKYVERAVLQRITKEYFAINCTPTNVSISEIKNFLDEYILNGWEGNKIYDYISENYFSNTCEEEFRAWRRKNNDWDNLQE